MAAVTLVLRDIHQPPAPPWWPPAPGWWMVAAAVLGVALAVWWWRQRNVRRHRRAAALFDEALAAAGDAPAQVAAMSELLRRAARRRDPAADRLEGEAWLAFLDGGDDGVDARTFRDGPGRLLFDGAFRPQLDADAVAQLRDVARRRFVAWMLRR